MAKGYNKPKPEGIKQPISVLADNIHPKTKQYNTIDLVKGLSDYGPIEKPVFANHAQISLDADHMFIDFYALMPKPDLTPEVIVNPVQRVVLPLSICKGMASVLVNVILNYEKDFGKELPDNRGFQTGDMKNIWEK